MYVSHPIDFFSRTKTDVITSKLFIYVRKIHSFHYLKMSSTNKPIVDIVLLAARPLARPPIMWQLHTAGHRRHLLPTAALQQHNRKFIILKTGCKHHTTKRSKQQVATTTTIMIPGTTTPITTTNLATRSSSSSMKKRSKSVRFAESVTITEVDKLAVKPHEIRVLFYCVYDYEFFSWKQKKRLFL